MVLGSLPCAHVRCERGSAAGPCSTVPSRWKREPWQGQSNVLASAFSAIEHPRWEQLIAKTFNFPCRSLTTNPPKARSPAALSPPPSAMTKAELGLVGASNLMAFPFDSCSMGVANVTASFVFFWPLAGAGHRKTRIGASPMATVAVRRLAIHQPRKVRRGDVRRHQTNHRHAYYPPPRTPRA